MGCGGIRSCKRGGRPWCYQPTAAHHASRPVAEKAALAQGLREHVWPLIEAGKIRPVIFKTFPLEEVAQAHTALEQGDHIGKIVMTIS